MDCLIRRTCQADIASEPAPARPRRAQDLETPIPAREPGLRTPLLNRGSWFSKAQKVGDTQIAFFL